MENTELIEASNRAAAIISEIEAAALHDLELSTEKIDKLQRTVRTEAARGDTSENAELNAAREELQKEFSVKANIESTLDSLTRINSTGYTPLESVQLYSTVRLSISDSSSGLNLNRIFTLYPAGISYPDKGIISQESKVGTILLGKKVGDEFSILSKQNTVVKYKVLELY